MVTSDLSNSNNYPRSTKVDAPCIPKMTSSAAIDHNMDVGINESGTTHFKGSKSREGLQLPKIIIFFSYKLVIFIDIFIMLASLKSQHLALVLWFDDIFILDLDAAIHI